MKNTNTSSSRRKAIEKISLAFGAMILPTSNWAKTGDGTPILLPEKKQLRPLNKTLTAITLGAGNRGNVYGNYAVEYSDQLDIVGVAEPIEIRRERYQQKHFIDKKRLFNTWEDVFKVEKFADAIIITTPDHLHYGPCMEALRKGYHVLLEKPISPSEQECRDILELANTTGKIVAVCHVLRYAPYFQKLQEIIQTELIGNLVSMQHFEPIGHVHMSHSFVRGNWHNSKECTPIILAKSCHDLDIIKWLVGAHCTHIQAFGDLSWFTQKNAPEGSTDRCVNGCTLVDTCPYSAKKIYLDRRHWLHHFDLPEDKSKHEAVIMDYLKTSNYGRCVYRSDNDQPDHITSNMLFENGVTVSFNMEALTSYHGRRTRIMGSMGDIVGDMNQFTHYDFRTRESTTWENKTDGHGGGDWRLVADWIQAIDKNDPNLLTSTISDSIESHIMGFKAEESRAAKSVIKVAL